MLKETHFVWKDFVLLVCFWKSMVVYLIFPNSGLFEKRLEGHSQVFVAVELEVF